MHYFTIFLTKVPSAHQGKREISSIQLNKLSYPTFRLLVTPKFTIPTKYKDKKTRVIRDYPLSASQSSSQPKVLSLVLVHVGQVSFILCPEDNLYEHLLFHLHLLSTGANPRNDKIYSYSPYMGKGKW